MAKPLLVGECNPYGADPQFALYPLPRNAAGDRLCRAIMGIPHWQYLAAFDRANLCGGAWAPREARARAEVIAAERRSTVVLLGARVCSAFGLPFRPFAVFNDFDCSTIVLPHPSGRSRIWNEPRSYERAREALRRGGALDFPTEAPR